MSVAGRLVRGHGWFLLALVAGIALRVVVLRAFETGFVYSDAHTYLGLSRDLQPTSSRVVGYAAFLSALRPLTTDIWVVAAIQHGLGLLTAVLAYCLLRRWGASGLVATLAVLPVLLDAMQLLMEQSILSDVVYDLVLVAGVAVLAWRRQPTVLLAALGGLVLGLSVLVRVSGQPVVISAVGFCLLAGLTWRARLLTSVVLVVAFVAPLAGYAAWYHAKYDKYALTESGGRALYMRTTGFVDCSLFEVPDYERRLCPREEIGQRRDPTYYGWHHPDFTGGLRPPRGITYNDAFGDFARRAIEAQRGDYLRIVARDALLPLHPTRTDDYEYDTAYKWQFRTWRYYVPPEETARLYAATGGPYRADPSLAGFLVGYGQRVYLWGPLMGMLAAVALVGLCWRCTTTRPLVFLTLTVGVGLTFVPIVTAEFVWRYVLPAVVLVPVAAAAAWTGVRRGGVSEPEPAPPPAPTGRTVE